MLILVGASASGKTEVANYLIEHYGLKKMVTYTTRKPRELEENGVAYHFVSLEEFEEILDNGEFIETVCYNGNYYGTRKSEITDDTVVILEPNGLKAFKNELKDKAIAIFLDVSEEVRIKRMEKRNDGSSAIKRRIVNDKIAFANIKGIDYTINNENITLEELANKIYNIYKERKMKVLVETSARHVHLSEEVFKVLFGEDAKLTIKKELSQPGQYACEERINVVGPKKALNGVSILGPFRKETQVELSATDARSIGLGIAIKESGDIKGTPGCVLEGPCGKVEIKEGVIVAKRHIHMTTKDAEAFGLVDKQIVSVKVANDVRTTIFGDVVVRVRDDFALAMHIDTDESNAAFVAPGTMGEIIK